MDTEMLITLFEYFTWGRNQVLDTAAGLTRAQLRQADEPGGYGSIWDTLAHMAASEWMWMERLTGQSPTAFPSGDNFADVAALRGWWDDVHSRSMTYLRGLTAADLAREIHYRNTQGREFRRRVWHVLLHIVNHQTEHRTQIAALFTRFGVAPPATDLVVYLPSDGS